MSVGSRMKERRESLGMTQVQLAELLGVTKGAIGNYETDANSPKASVLYKVFEVLKCDANYLFQDEIRERRECTASPQEMEYLVKKYRLLDPYGKEAVDGVLDVESRRCREERQKQAAILREQREQSEAAEEIAPEDIYSIPLYSLPMSAGTGQEAGQEYPEDFLLKKRPPRGTSFIARVSGNSMEPTYYDGVLVFIHASVDIRPGQTGAFLMDGQLWIKELGDGVLISHNPDYGPRKFTEDIRCQGLVLGVCDQSYFKD